MKRNKRNKHPLLFSVLTYTVSTLLLVSLFSAFALRLENPNAAFFPLSLAVFPIASLLSSLIVTKYKGENAIKESFASSLVLSALIIIAGIFFSNGNAALTVALNSIVLVLSSVLFSYLLRPKFRRRRR